MQVGTYDTQTPIRQIYLTVSISYIILASFESEINGNSDKHYSHIYNAQESIHVNDLRTGINQKWCWIFQSFYVYGAIQYLE